MDLSIKLYKISLRDIRRLNWVGPKSNGAPHLHQHRRDEQQQHQVQMGTLSMRMIPAEMAMMTINSFSFSLGSMSSMSSPETYGKDPLSPSTSQTRFYLI